mgnify:FL=1
MEVITSSLIELKKMDLIVCREAGISRPTLDKMLLGNITNKTNYDKHLTKIMQVFVER